MNWFLKELEKIRGEKIYNISNANSNEYRIIVNEANGLTAYYCSLPIYNTRDKRLLNLEWQDVEDKKVFEGINARVEVAGEYITLSNKNGVLRIGFSDDVRVELTLNGICVSCKKEKLVIDIELNSPMPVRANNVSFAFMQNEFIPFAVVNTLFGKSNNKIFPIKIEPVTIKENHYNLNLISKENAQELFCEINLHVPKLILDTTVESKNPDKNNAFGAVAFLGNSKEYGEQWLYSRFNVMQFTDLNYYRVESANLYAKRFSDTDIDLKAYKMSMPWCSFGSTWNTKTNYSELISTARVLHNYKIIDVTAIIKDILRINEPRNPGVVLKAENCTNETEVIATGDCYISPQILEIKLIR